jgi:UDP-4-amino-4,6-dideoxy-N-acetyl-beta-L-altrosamine N-acetyltransferase
LVTTTAAIRLRALAATDEARVLAWRNEPEVARWMATDHQVTAAEHGPWFASSLADPAKRYWIIELDGAPVGLIGLYEISAVDRRAEWGFYIADPAVRGHGVGASAWRSVLAVAFGELGLDTVVAEVLRSNEHSLAMHEHFGFHVDGVAGQVLKDGRLVDVLTLHLRRQDWQAALEGAR